jgi:hypothetical protein
MRKKPVEIRKDEPTQETSKGQAIPIPKRRDFLRDLKKAATPGTPAKSRCDRPKQ